MHFLAETFLLISLLSFANTAPSNPKFVVHEKRDELPHWQYRKLDTRNHEEVAIPMRIAMAQRNLHRGYEFLMDVSHPSSKNFGKHWTEQQVHDMFSPNQESVDHVKEWLVSSGIDESGIKHVGVTKWMYFNATVREAENLLKTKYHVYTNLQNGEEHISCDHYSIPEHLREHIELITPTTSLVRNQRRLPGQTTWGSGKTRQQIIEQKADLLSKRQSTLASKPNPKAKKPVDLSTDLSKCSEALAPQCIKALYNFPDGDKATPGNELGIAEWTDTYETKAVEQFLRNFTNIPANTIPTMKTIDGGEHARLTDGNLTAAHTESNLDFQVSYPIIYPQNSILYQVGDDIQGPDFDDLLLTWDPEFQRADGGDSPENTIYPTPENFLQLSGSLAVEPDYKGFTGKKQVGGIKRPTVFSSSYGQGEVTLSPAYQNRQCNEYMKLGLMGTSVLYATGDSGVGSELGCIPLRNDNATVQSAQQGLSGAFVADFPANCPYVTAVGGTMLKPGKGVEAGEVALYAPTIRNVTINLAGGGGFSNAIFSTPDYQKEAVQTYLKNFPPPYNSSLFNSSGRAYPDISAVGLSFQFVNRGEIRPTGFGTSIAAPLVASLVVRINEERLAANKSTVGFLNPTLYASKGKGMNDVVEGSNAGCGTVGFNATKGWDPATGWGTPNYEKLLKVFMELP